MDTTSREIRDQYQLGRLQARINRRRELPREITSKGNSPNSKTLRSSRIKTARHLYSNHRGPNNQESSQYFSGATSIHGTITNNTSSTIPSLNHGQSISRSLTSSTSGVQETDNESVQLSEYRGKLFAKMLLLLQDLSPNKETIQEDDVSNIKDMVVDEESRASCYSVAELKLIQKLTEEEMSRILYEFEQNNSLIEKKDQVPYKGIPEFKYEREPSANNMRMEEDPPEKIMYRDIGMSIASKFSDVTSPTCHDGFELDEIMPTTHRQPMMLPPLPRSAHHHKKRLPPSLSPVAAAAASVAASMPLASGNKCRSDQQQPHHLPCVLEIRDTIELNEDDDNGANNGKGEQALVEEEDKVECGDGKSLVSQDKIGNDAGGKRCTDKDMDISNHLELADEAEVGGAIESPKDTAQNVPAMDHSTDQPGDEEDTDEILASSREMAQRAVDEEHFHNEILSAVANAAAASVTDRRGDSRELCEVTSILSMYEEAEKSAKDEIKKARQEEAEKVRKEVAKLLEGLENEQRTTVDNASSFPFDQPVSPKKVKFLEPLPGAQNQAMCGCPIQ